MFYDVTDDPKEGAKKEHIIEGFTGLREPHQKKLAGPPRFERESMGIFVIIYFEAH